MKEKKKRRTKRYLLQLLFTLCFFLFLPTPTLTVRAETGGNADGSGGGQGTQHVVGGPYHARTGWLVYVIDETNNTQVSETKVFYSSSERPPANCITYPKTRFGGNTNGYQSGTDAEWEPKTPYGENGAPHGSAVKSYMIKGDYALYFIDDYFGADLLASFKEQELCLIMEPFYWGQMYSGKKATGIWLCGTAYGWADYQDRFGLGDYGSPLINRFTNNTYPNCVKLEFPQFGLSPLSGLLNNNEVMTSGNGFLAIWANESTELPENTEEIDEGRQLYAIKNWSDEYDISKAIPSGEMVKNAYEADSFFANATVETETSAPKTYSATYTYKRNNKVVSTHTFSFTAQVSYQKLSKVQAYALDNLKVVNEAFATSLEYDKSNSSTWYDVKADVKRYLADGGYENEGLLDCKDMGEEHHYFLPDTDTVGDKEIQIDKATNLEEKKKADVEEAKKAVFDAAWSRNDQFVIHVGDTPYIFMQDNTVTGCIFDDPIKESTDPETGKSYKNTSAASSEYRYGGAGIFADSVKPAKQEGEQEIIIPPSTDNLSYPTGVTAVYKNLANTKSDVDAVFRAGRGIYETGKVDSIYDHIIESDNSYGSAHNRQDYPIGDGYDIKVHTPVISPIMITTYLGTPQWYPDEQLIDVDEDAEFQLKLDANYMVKWNLDQWVSYKYGELTGYEQDGGYPSRYDKYVERKELKFPFDVYYEGQFYEAGTWIHITEPNDYEALWSDGLSLEEKSSYQSNNHWQMTPFYIPSYAEEGSGNIEARVYAYNVEGRYEGSHNVTEAMELTMNSEDTNYIATYEVSNQLSGHIYGFTVVGVDDTDMYDELYFDQSVWERLEFPLCPEKEEKVSGVKNRFGEPYLRYQKDGSLHQFTVYADGHIKPDYNLLPLREGSNETAGIHTGDGRLWLGTGFSFNLKTIANLWDDNDYIQITPTFKFYSKDGELMDTIYMDGDIKKSTNDRISVLYGDDTVFRDFFKKENEKNFTVTLSDRSFKDSYYTDAQTIPEKRYGNWVPYTIERWNKYYGLSGMSARNKREMMNLSYPCYTNTLITLDKNFRMLSGEFEQLYKNRQREGSDVATYFDFNEDGYFDDGIKSSLETDFRDSMQTWYGRYCMPGKMRIYDSHKNGDFENKDKFTEEDFLTDCHEIVINFDIIAYKNGKPHLSYGGYINGGKVWEKEGYDTKEETYDEGDVVTYETGHRYGNKFEGHLINVN